MCSHQEWDLVNPKKKKNLCRKHPCLFPAAWLCHFLENNDYLSPSTLVMWLLLSWCHALNAWQTNLICPPRNHMQTLHPCNRSVCVWGSFTHGCACICVCMHMQCVKLDPTAESRAGNPTPRLQQKAFVATSPPLLFNPPIQVSKSRCTHRPVCWQSGHFNAGSEFPGWGQTGLVKKGVRFSDWSCCHFHPLHWCSLFM